MRRFPGGLLPALILGILVLGPAPGFGADPDIAWLTVGGERMSYDEAEQLLRGELPIESASHKAKSDDASTIKMQMAGGWRAKLRIVSDLGGSNSNEDPKLDVAAYVVARWLFPKGSLVYPSVVRDVDVADVSPHLDEEGRARLQRWSQDGTIPAIVSLIGEGATRAGESDWYGDRLTAEIRVPPGILPETYLRQLGDMNVFTILVRNSDMYGKNWEIREEDGACFVVDHGTSFPYGNPMGAFERWRRPCILIAPAVAASTVEKVRRLVEDPAELDLALAALQDTSWGLPADFRVIVFEQAEKFLKCLDRMKDDKLLRMKTEDFMLKIGSGALLPYRDEAGRHQPLVLVTDW